VNPLAVDRYRDRVRVSGARSDPGDAKVLVDMVRTDAHQHRPVAADSDLAEAVKLVARAHRSAIWSRRCLVSQVRSALREFYPAAQEAFGDLSHSDAVSVLAIAPTPGLGKGLSLSKIASALRRGGDRLVAILHGCLRHRTLYDENLAWAHRNDIAARYLPHVGCLTCTARRASFDPARRGPDRWRGRRSSGSGALRDGP